MSLKGKTSIFEGISNIINGIDPTSIRMISDRVLVKDLGDLEAEGRIIIPEAYRERGLNQYGTYRRGLVISVGPGDRFREVGIEEWGNEAPRVRRELLTQKQTPCPTCEGSPLRCGRCGLLAKDVSGDTWNCPKCGGTGCLPMWFDIRDYRLISDRPCDLCHGTNIADVPVCVPPQCAPGDIVLFEKRREAEIYINGERYCIFNAEQGAIAVLEEA